MPLFVIAEHIANGLLVGSYFIVLALGLSLIFSLGGVVNLAHGAFYALGAYLAFEIQRRLGFFGAMVLSPVGVASSASSSRRCACAGSIARTRGSVSSSPSASRWWRSRACA